MPKIYWIFSSLFWASIIFRLTTSTQTTTVSDTVLQQIMMLGAHFAFFGVQAIFLYKALRPHKQSPLLSIGATSIYGLAIEAFQRGVPGRTADPVDWLLDTLGAAICIVLVRKYSE